MMDSSKHTPTPWYTANWTCHAPRTVLVDDAAILTGKRVVAECDRDDDAAFIVRACNAHDQLVAALRGGRVAIDVLMAQLIEVDPSFIPTQSAAWPALVAIVAALGAAEA